MFASLFCWQFFLCMQLILNDFHHIFIAPQEEEQLVHNADEDPNII